MKKLIAVTLLSSLAFMAHADDATTAVPYQYGMKLDIARVISQTPTPHVCDVVPMQLTYEDSHGERHILQFSEWGDGCTA